VIHTPGPVWKGGGGGEADLLRSCYRASLRLAEECDEIASIAFPCISTGVYGYPLADAARIAVESCRDTPLAVTFCCFSPADLAVYEALLGAES